MTSWLRMPTKEIFERGYAMQFYNIFSDRLTLKFRDEYYELPASADVLRHVDWFPDFRLARMDDVRAWLKANGR